MRTIGIAALLALTATAEPPRWEALLAAGRDREAARAVAGPAAAGRADALAFQARLYDEGRGVRADQRRAVALTRRAAEAGDLFSQSRVGLMHLLGDGVPQNEWVAAAWFRRAAAGGWSDAHVSLGLMAANGDAGPVDPEEAQRQFRIAAKLGNPRALREIGDTYWLGRGTPRDKLEALAWYTVALERGERPFPSTLADWKAGTAANPGPVAARAAAIRAEFPVPPGP